jgi:hypothetical protein
LAVLRDEFKLTFQGIIPNGFVKFTDQTLACVGMRNIAFRFIVITDLIFIGTWIGKLKTAAFAVYNLKCFLAYGVILAGNKRLKRASATTRTVG